MMAMTSRRTKAARCGGLRERGWAWVLARGEASLAWFGRGCTPWKASQQVKEKRERRRSSSEKCLNMTCLMRSYWCKLWSGRKCKRRREREAASVKA